MSTDGATPAWRSQRAFESRDGTALHGGLADARYASAHHHPPQPPQPGLPNPQPDVPLVPPAGDDDPSQPDDAPGEIGAAAELNSTATLAGQRRTG